MVRPRRQHVAILLGVPHQIPQHTAQPLESLLAERVVIALGRELETHDVTSARSRDFFRLSSEHMIQSHGVADDLVGEAVRRYGLGLGVMLPSVS